MNGNKKRTLITSLLIVLIAGVTIALAYFTATDSANNIFNLANKYTLTYHANAGSPDEDAKVTKIPEQQSKYKEGDNAVVFDVAEEKPLRPGSVFQGWY